VVLRMSRLGITSRDLVDGNAASWHLDALVEVLAVDAGILFNLPAWAVGLAWQTQTGL